MTDQTTMPDWVLTEAANRCGLCEPYNLTWEYANNAAFAALCDMILKHEQPPVDRKVLCAREANALGCDQRYNGPTYFRSGAGDHDEGVQRAIHAIDLYLEGFGQ